MLLDELTVIYTYLVEIYVSCDKDAERYGEGYGVAVKSEIPTEDCPIKAIRKIDSSVTFLFSMCREHYGVFCNDVTPCSYE